MNRGRTTEGLARENARIRRERNAARDALTLRNRVLHEYQLEAVERRIEGRLAMEDFETFIKLDLVLDRDGRLDVWKLEQHVSALLERRPRLALTVTTDAGGTVIASARRDEAESGTASSDVRSPRGGNT